MDKRPSITLKTSDFAFTNNDLAFIKKYVHGKYPSVMSNVIEKTRLLMKAIQTLAKSNAKLTYYASRIHPDNTDRYVVSEMLAEVENSRRAIISIEPIEEKTKEHYDFKAVHKTIRRIQGFLENPTHSPKGVRLVTCGNIPHRQILQALGGYFESVKQEIVVRSSSFALDSAEDPHVFFEIRHKATLSHYVRIQFDFFEFSSAERIVETPITQVVEQESQVDQTPTEETSSE